MPIAITGSKILLQLIIRVFAENESNFALDDTRLPPIAGGWGTFRSLLGVETSKCHAFFRVCPISPASAGDLKVIKLIASKNLSRRLLRQSDNTFVLCFRVIGCGHLSFQVQDDGNKAFPIGAL